MTTFLTSRRWFSRFAVAGLLLGAGMLFGFGSVQADEPPAVETDSNPEAITFTETFDQGADRWQPTEPEGWKTETIDGRTVYHQFVKKDSYKPPHRSPFHIALLKDVNVGSFELKATVKSTHADYPHRDACLFFNYEGPDSFYYVHLGKSTDDHANQIFIVNHADRTKISTKTTTGTPWTDGWHDVLIQRDSDSGKIEVFFDDMTTPAMVASDKTFTSGQIGIGSFDDTTAWDSVTVSGTSTKPVPVAEK